MMEIFVYNLDFPLCEHRGYIPITEKLFELPYSDEFIAYCIYSRYKETLFPIYFNSKGEGFSYPYLSRADKIIKILINNYNVNIRKISYVNGSMNVDYNVESYRKLCKKYDWTIINLYFSDLWETWHYHEDRVLNTEPKLKSKTFLFFNRSPRTHRMAAVAELLRRNILDKGFTSIAMDENDINRISDPNSNWDLEYINNFPLYYKEHMKLLDENKNLFPMHLNLQDDWTNMHIIDEKDFLYYNNTYISLVSESVYIADSLQASLDGHFATEKTFKCIQIKHPFFILSRPHFLKSLHKIGYKTFHPFINESYDDIENDEERLLAVMNELERLCYISDQEWIEIQKSIKPVLEHNFNVRKDKITQKSPYIIRANNL